MLKAKYNENCASEVTCEMIDLAVNGVKNYDYSGTIKGAILAKSGYYKLEVWGGQGGRISSRSASSGLGGYSYGNIELNELDILYIAVGGAGVGVYDNSKTGTYIYGGYNGGGDAIAIYNSGSVHYACGASGGGATHIALNKYLGLLYNYKDDQDAVLIVAGGGGGAGYGVNCGQSVTGGSGGGLVGGSSASGNPTGGSQTQGGTGNGKGIFGSAHPSRCSGSGGGGGWYGGGCITYGAGAGGSGYVDGVLNGSTSNGQRSGNGYARITYLGTTI